MGGFSGVAWRGRHWVPLLVLAVLAAGTLIMHRGGDRLVVYCAHDALYSEAILARFSRRTGIRLEIRYDTEATKSLGLTEMILREGVPPVCDVFWNNEVLGMMELAERGMLMPYRSAVGDRIPACFRDPEDRWYGFAGRFRVVIVNQDETELSAADPQRIWRQYPERFAVAKPLYGTTLTQYVALWHEMGGEALRRLHRDMRARGVREVLGNATVKDCVASGACMAGWTDTDDAFLALDAGAPVAMSPLRTPAGKTICIPNAVGIIRGSHRLAAARRLVDYLLSEETELALAASPSRQVPLGTVDETRLSAEVRRERSWLAQSVLPRELAASRRACLAWLKRLYVGGGT